MECLIAKDKEAPEEKIAPIAKLESLDELDLVSFYSHLRDIHYLLQQIFLL